MLGSRGACSRWRKARPAPCWRPRARLGSRKIAAAARSRIQVPSLSPRPGPPGGIAAARELARSQAASASDRDRSACFDGDGPAAEAPGPMGMEGYKKVTVAIGAIYYWCHLLHCSRRPRSAWWDP